MRKKSYILYRGIITLCIFGIIGCTTQESEINAILEEKLEASIERGKNITIYYSDSAQVKVVIYAPQLERVTLPQGAKDIFNKGVMVEFLDANKKEYSWLKADQAIRDPKESKITATGNVIFYNAKEEKLETPELIWDESKRIVYTDKLIRITQAERGDTTFGFGFQANENFTRFEIKKKVQGKINTALLSEELNIKN